MRARTTALTLTCALCLCTTACSYLQTKAVGDEYVQGAQAAIVDVLAEAGLSTRTGPDCTVSADATSLDCVATTTTGADVAARAAGGDSNDLEAAELTVTVAGERLFTGTVAAVLTQANE